MCSYEILLCSSVVVLLSGSVMLFRPVISALFLVCASGKVGNQNREEEPEPKTKWKQERKRVK